ncbi:MAG: hypothetical protein HN348_09475 [Proteobacteria bacterium]|nr:hypothetical protein [Pseudomonadota bacterium]
MDLRLDAGRHHLSNGDQGLQWGYLDDARTHFEAALLQFRGPELRVGEAHSLRGLSRVELGCGNLAIAEKHIREAMQVYQSVPMLLQKHDSDGVSFEVQHDAAEGEASSLVLLAEIMVRAGRNTTAREALSDARNRYRQLGEVPSAVGLWLLTGRLSLREGQFELAEKDYETALELVVKFADMPGEAAVQLSIAELHRLKGHIPRAESALERVFYLADRMSSVAHKAKAATAMGGLMLQKPNTERALHYYEEALQLAQRCRDTQSEGFALLGLGILISDSGEGGAMELFGAAARLFASLGHSHALGTTLLRMAQHGLRVEKPSFALVAAEMARKMWEEDDPVQGVGQALRSQVKALARLEEWNALYLTACARAIVAGQVQSNALDVWEFYRQRAPEALLDELKGMPGSELIQRANRSVTNVIRGLLKQYGLPASTLDSVPNTLAVVGLLYKVETLARSKGRPPDEEFDLLGPDEEPIDANEDNDQ